MKKHLKVLKGMKQLDYNKFMAGKPDYLTSITNQKEQSVKLYDSGTDSGIVVGVINEIAFVTDFFDTADFGKDSDYNPIMLDDKTVVCAFETIY
jgi:hypothetical protein